MVDHHTLRISRALPAEADTLALGGAIARGLQLEKIRGLTIYLHGDLGAGKTTLVRGLLHGLGFNGRVKSPTFALLEPYEVSSLYLYHFDLYRFDASGNGADEWADSGFREYFNDAAICLVEWPEKAGGNLPAPDIEIDLSIAGDGRNAELVAHTEAGKHCLAHVHTP